MFGQFRTNRRRGGHAHLRTLRRRIKHDPYGILDLSIVRVAASAHLRALHPGHARKILFQNGEVVIAQSLRDPLYLAIADDETIRRVVRYGVRGTAMPAFAQSAGGDVRR